MSVARATRPLICPPAAHQRLPGSRGPHASDLDAGRDGSDHRIRSAHLSSTQRGLCRDAQTFVYRHGALAAHLERVNPYRRSVLSAAHPPRHYHHHPRAA